MDFLFKKNIANKSVVGIFFCIFCFLIIPVKTKATVPVQEQEGRLMNLTREILDTSREILQRIDGIYQKEVTTREDAPGGESWDAAAWRQAKIMLRELNTQTIQWALQGDENGPLLVPNIQEYLKVVRDKTAQTYIFKIQDTVVRDWLCKEFQPIVEQGFVGETIRENQAGADERQMCPSQDEFGHGGNNCNQMCEFNEESMEAAHAESFIESGGFEELANTSIIQNNIYGIYLLAREEIKKKQTEAEYFALLDVILGQGFRSQMRCVQEETGSDGTRYCLKNVVTIPSSLIKEQVSNALTSEMRQLETADEIHELPVNASGELIRAINELISIIFMGPTGLNEIGDLNEPERI